MNSLAQFLEKKKKRVGTGILTGIGHFSKSI
jgi:hypothetical protein